MKTERGFALIQVLLVFAMLAVIVAKLQYEQRIQIERAYQGLFLSQAQAYIDSAEAIARTGLQLDLDNTDNDHFAEQWNQPLGPFPVEEGAIALELNDLQGRFNVNWLHPDASAPQQAAEGFKRLLLALELDEGIANELLNWFDADSGAEFEYSDQQPSYRPSFLPMADVSELRLLKSIDREAYQRLRPYVAALPAGEPLNVNTAGPLVLMTLAEFIGEGEADALIETAGEEGYDSTEAFLNQPAFQQDEDAPLLIDNLSVVSYWFSLYAEVTLGERRLSQESRLYRDAIEGVLVTQRSRAASEPNRSPGDTVSGKNDEDTE